MERRMIINDIKANKLVSAATCIFMAVTAMLLGLSILLYASLADSIDSLMTEAKTPDFLQMHTGELDMDRLNDFAQQREDIEAMQVCTFLNLQNSQISIGNESFENNMQDNGLSCQSSLCAGMLQEGVWDKIRRCDEDRKGRTDRCGISA